MFLKPNNMSFPEEDDRISEMDMMWLLEKEAEMFVEWQQWEDVQTRLPAEIVVLTPILKEDEIQSDSFPFS